MSLNYGRDILGRLSRELAGQQKLSRILDVGAGSGADLEICRQASPSAALHAIESFAPNVSNLRTQGIEVTHGNIERDAFSYPDESFDLIIANQILEHCKEIFWIFHEVSRTLKPGGVFYIGLPNLASLHNRILLSAGLQPTAIQIWGPHVRGFTKNSISTFLNRVAPQVYCLERFQGANYYPFPPLIAKPLSRLFPGSAASIFFILRKNGRYRSEFIKYLETTILETNFYTGQREDSV